MVAFVGLLICRPPAVRRALQRQGESPRRDCTDTVDAVCWRRGWWEARVVTGPAARWSIQTNAKRKTATCMAGKRKWDRQECGCGKDGRDDEKTRRREDEKRSQAMRWDDGMSEVEQWEMRLWGRRAGGQPKVLGVLGKKQKGGVVPLVLRPRDPREGVQGGRAGIDHLSGTRRHLQFPENPEGRTEAEQHSFSHSATVCVHCPATFPLHAFWRKRP